MSFRRLWLSSAVGIWQETFGNVAMYENMLVLRTPAASVFGIVSRVLITTDLLCSGVLTGSTEVGDFVTGHYVTSRMPEIYDAHWPPRSLTRFCLRTRGYTPYIREHPGKMRRVMGL